MNPNYLWRLRLCLLRKRKHSITWLLWRSDNRTLVPQMYLPEARWQTPWWSPTFFSFLPCFRFWAPLVMNTIASKASFLLVLLLFLQSVFAQDPISSCDGISNGTRSQICLSGQCPLRCYTNSSNDPNCDQVCVVQPCAALSCNSTNCLQRCLSGGCNSLVCTGADCTQTCLGNCSEINCTVTAKCNQQCEKGHCGLRGMGYGVVEQTCAENCKDVKCKADRCRQTCAGDGCSLECPMGKWSNIHGPWNIQRQILSGGVLWYPWNPRLFLNLTRSYFNVAALTLILTLHLRGSPPRRPSPNRIPRSAPEWNVEIKP